MLHCRHFIPTVGPIATSKFPGYGYMNDLTTNSRNIAEKVTKNKIPIPINQALADAQATPAGIKCLYCNFPPGQKLYPLSEIHCLTSFAEYRQFGPIRKR